MARDMTPILKRCRALGINPADMGRTGKPSKRQLPNQRRKISEYGEQLREKQKAKFIYGVLEKPFRNNFNRAKKLKYGTTGENMMILLELRLDNVVYRLGFGRTRKEARQIVSHRMVTVNGRVVSVPSYTVSVGDKIEIRETKKGLTRMKDVLETTEGRLVPAWLSSDRENLVGTVEQIPTRDQIDIQVNEVLIVELYSK